MPTAVVDIDLATQATVRCLDGYSRAFVLVRQAGRPIGHVVATVVDGRLDLTLVPLPTAKAIDDPLATPLAGDSRLPITVAICTRDRPDDLRRCLLGVQELADKDREILVVDNAPRSEASRAIAATFPDVRYSLAPRPGLNRARNHALRTARSPLIAFIDDDAVPDRQWLTAIRQAFAEPRVMAVTGLTLPLELETPAQECFERLGGFGRGYQRRLFDQTIDEPTKPGWIGAGVNMAVRRSILNTVGAFDEALDAGTPTHSGGDYDLFSRILTAGYQIVYEPAALNWHRHRREWSALRRLYYGYGVGLSAAWTRSLVVDHQPAAARSATGWLLRWLMPMIGRSVLRRPDHAPLDLLLCQLAGFAIGPAAYYRSARSRPAREVRPTSQLRPRGERPRLVTGRKE